MKEIFNESYREYNEYMSTVLPDFWEGFSYKTRRQQCESLINSLNERFNFNRLITIETGTSQNPKGDGAFGIFLGFATEKTNGIMMSVDINDDYLKKSNELFSSVIPKLKYETYKDDSVHFLKNVEIIPNLVHLDSWDLDLKNPLPSALHGWNEFVAIESKMLSGSIIVIDDNYIKGQWVEWIYGDGRPSEKIDIVYPILGKGAHIYQHVLSGNSDWELIGEHHKNLGNIKIIIQKK